MSLRFVHTADLHLDSPVEGVTAGMPTALAEQVREASLTTLDRVVTLCQEQQVDFLLVAGDLFDQSDRGLRAQMRWRRAVAELGRSRIAVYLVHGNHDDLGRRQTGEPAGGNWQWPANLSVFPAGQAQVQVWREPQPSQWGVRVFGISYPRRAVREDYAGRLQDLRRRQAPVAAGLAGFFDIALLHADISGQADNPYAPVSVPELLGHGPAEPDLPGLTLPPFDYWALGHVHERAILHPGQPVVAYPGNTQGRGFAEPGWRGVYLVTVPDDPSNLPPGARPVPQVQFIPVQAIVWQGVQVQINEASTEEELVAALEERMAAAVDQYRRLPPAELPGQPPRQMGYIPAGVMLRIEVVGRSTPLYRWLQSEQTRNELLETLRDAVRGEATPWVWPASVEVRVQPQIDWAKLQQEDGFLGELVRLGQVLQEAIAGAAETAAAAAAGPDKPSQPQVAPEQPPAEPAGGVGLGQLFQWLQPLREKKELAAWLDRLPPEELQRWVEAARTRLVESLLEEEE